MLNPIVIIPARKGSKGVPGKNTKMLAGKPLIAHTFEAALDAFSPDQICVTTDDQKVIEIANSYDIIVPFVRPEELASDSVAMDTVIRHALTNFSESKNKTGYDTIVLLQPTSPFRRASHIKEAMSLFTKEVDMVVSVKETKSNPYYFLFEENEMGYLEKSKEGNFKTRQECPKVWEYNGAIYIINTNSFKNHSPGEFKKIKKYVMNEVDSLDIDTIYDWKLAEAIIENQDQN